MNENNKKLNEKFKNSISDLEKNQKKKKTFIKMKLFNQIKTQKKL